ncbi:outer membrane beta-barrel protein [Caulobacter sp. UNC358MFTsu5.1]|uniref:outer membrane beta-barrel protein n=1 Tax=Caulobacter sp. UNC358MFTsu5.1 TaxID=1449049 RepID=UPI0004A6D73F|nr:outer membrane beta-barrel protein [Caulobacter sp. UNC358MFTsu5.1]
MKTQLFAAAAVLAVAVSAPAFAQNVGSVGAAVNYTDVKATGIDADGTSFKVDGNVAIPTGAWTVTVNGNVSVNDNDLSDETVASTAAHATTLVAGDTVRVGGFAALSRPSNDTLWAVGAEASKYFDKATVTGLVAYGQSNDLDADLVAVRADARYFVSDDFRLDAGVGYSNIDPKGFQSADLWDFNVGGEYKFANSGWSTFGKYTHTEAKDLADLNAEAVKVGFRYTFGGSLKTRDRSGADLIDADTLFGFGVR